MIHHFPFDPREVLGVPADATPEQVHDAFRDKSKKHHPDLGGDEWAFRMVARAYEVLKATSEGASPPAEPPPWVRRAASDFFSQGRFPFGAADAGPSATATATATAAEPTAAEPEPEPPRAEPPGVFQQVEVELIWIRFGMPGATAEHAEGGTLSVCMVVSWPLRSLVSRSAEYANLDKTLRRVIDAFDDLRRGAGPLSARSRIEDGQFVGWLSFPDVLAAQAAFLRLRDDLRGHDMTVHLQTRDEVIPESWAG
ncbi:J domain-containing protein [Paludisphaera sp.]|uniref:J domain-containing protein n=1 Tax=Paludisphaera sp. TaxID=2017432 RepID=UPI00301E47B3